VVRTQQTRRKKKGKKQEHEYPEHEDEGGNNDEAADHAKDENEKRISNTEEKDAKAKGSKADEVGGGK